MKANYQIIQGDCLERLKDLPSESVHCCVTSPPYYNLRDYNTASWDGGDPACDHKGRSQTSGASTLGEWKNGGGKEYKENAGGMPYLGECGKCGAVRIDQQIGLEPTPAEFVATMVRVFEEVRRVLRSDGVCFMNLGDSYAGSGKGIGSDHGKAVFSDDNITKTDWAASGFKAKDLMLIPHRVAIALQDAGWYVRSDMPWVKRCLSGGSIIYAKTQKGEMPMMLKDLVRLDPATVQLWNGEKWTQVKGFCQTKPERSKSRLDQSYLEIELRSGERIGCTADHRWPTMERGVVRTDELRVKDVLQTSVLPEPVNVIRPHGLDDGDIGWFVGLFLAEGCISERTIIFSGHTNETADRLKRLGDIARAYGGTAYVGKKLGNAESVCVSGGILRAILKEYISGDNAKNKRLTTKSWQRSNMFLRSLLLAYLEGDGHWDAKNNRWRLGFCNNDGLASDLRSMSARLGIECRIRRGTATAVKDGPKFKTWRGEIRLGVRPEMTTPGGFPQTDVSEIVAIRRGRARMYWDIEVEDDPHLFALSSGVLTHNSAMPESVTDRPAKALEYVFMLTKSEKYFADMEAVRVKGSGLIPGNRNDAKAAAEYKNGDEKHRTKSGLADYAQRQRDRSLPNNRNGENGNLDATPAGGRNFRNSDLWFSSLREPHGLVSIGDELVGLDVNPSGFKESHFATFAPKLIEPLIKMGTSEKGCCVECGAPWKRTTETEYSNPGNRSTNGPRSIDNRDFTAGFEQRLEKTTSTTGWQPTCTHDAETQPCTVLDPFAGAGTTLLVSKRLGRNSVGIELNPTYIEMIEHRLAHWHKASPPPVAKAGADLPLFG